MNVENAVILFGYGIQSLAAIHGYSIAYVQFSTFYFILFFCSLLAACTFQHFSPFFVFEFRFYDLIQRTYETKCSSCVKLSTKLFDFRNEQNNARHQTHTHCHWGKCARLHVFDVGQTPSFHPPKDKSMRLHKALSDFFVDIVRVRVLYLLWFFLVVKMVLEFK